MAQQNRSLVLAALAATAAAVLVVGQALPSSQPRPQPRQQTEQQTQQQTEIILSITGEPGAPPRYAVPDLLALSADAETAAAAKTIGQVLFDDLAFEREFYMIPRDTYVTIPAARTVDDVPFDRWRELGADGLVVGSVQKIGTNLRVVIRLYDVRTQRSVFAKEYTGSTANPRFYAHTASDELHQQQRALRGVARTKLTFQSDRDGERVTGTVQTRDVKEIYISDYDGANQRRVTVSRHLNATPWWTPDGRGIAYTSWRRGFPDIFVSMIYQTLPPENPTNGTGHNWLPAWSPDGQWLVFTSNRDGNPELYIMRRDGTETRRLTNHPAVDTSPTWSPAGRHIAFLSDRTGSPQIYVVGVDGLGLYRLTLQDSYCDRPTWSPAPFNEIAYTARTGPGYDIRIIDLATKERRQITFSEGSNESPAYAPNGRHMAFMSTRSGKQQIFTVGRDGRGLRQVTRTGNNHMPNWSQ
jgi:TolB protein